MNGFYRNGNTRWNRLARIRIESIHSDADHKFLETELEFERNQSITKMGNVMSTARKLKRFGRNSGRMLKKLKRRCSKVKRADVRPWMEKHPSLAIFMVVWSIILLLIIVVYMYMMLSGDKTQDTRHKIEKQPYESLLDETSLNENPHSEMDESAPLMEDNQSPCMNKPMFTDSTYKDGENPYFGAKNDTAISLFLSAFRNAALVSGTEPMLATGSLLGWRRHCKFNAHDGDIDLHIFNEGWDRDLFERELRTGLHEAGFDGEAFLFDIGTGHFSVDIRDDKRYWANELGVSHIDIYVLYRRGDIMLYNPLWMEPDHVDWLWFPLEWAQPLSYEDVYGVQFGIIQEPDLYLNHFFGKGWESQLDEDNHGEGRGSFDGYFISTEDPAVYEHFGSRQTADGTWVWTIELSDEF